ncbi:hypothetical protein [Candidatus Lokiarchaeum ossiferum]|uniref:hypothetical protein n=1 Tax=Candidatus Lokiarchaeum ossiferum TaxID=2951803 RepID=UPI00352EF7A8
MTKKKDTMNIKIRKANTTKLRIITSLGFVFLWFSSILSPVMANPWPMPMYFSNFEFGIQANHTNISHIHSNISINVYDTFSQGNGSYLLRNKGNLSIELPISFPLGPGFSDVMGFSSTEDRIQQVLANDSEVQVRIWGNNDEIELYEGRFNLSFLPYSDILLNIVWKFNSSVEDDYFDFLGPVTEKRRMYYTGYTIKGGKNWNDQPIESEYISFIFHTDNFWVEESTISLFYTNNSEDLIHSSSIKAWREVVSEGNLVLVNSTNNTPSLNLKFSDIVDDIHINIVNDASSYTLSGMGYMYLTSIIVSVGIIVLVMKRKKQ